MLETAYVVGLKNGSGRGWHYDFTLSEQKIFVLIWHSEQADNTKLVIDDFLKTHLSALERLDSEDIELLVLKLTELLGECDIAVVVLRNDSVLYAVTGASVFFSRGEQQGYLTTGENKLSLFQAVLLEKDVLLFGLGTDKKTMLVSSGQRFSGEGIGLEVLCHKEPIPVVVQKTPLLTKLKDHISKRRMVEPSVYVKNDERKKFGKIALLLFVILLVSVGLGWRKRQAETARTAFEAVYAPALNLLVKAEAIYRNEPLPAREMLMQAQTTLTQALTLYEQDSQEHEKLTTLNGKVKALYAQVSGEKQIEKPEVFFDLHLVKDDMNGSKIAFGDGQVVALDTHKGILVGIDSATKNAKVLAGGEILAGASLLTASTGKAVVLSQKGLVGVFFGERAPEVLIPNDDVWENPKALGMFGGSVYLADAQTNEIWHYPGFEGGLGERRRWFGPGVTPDLTTITSLAVDGDIWVGSGDGRLQHFRRGAPLNVRLTGLTTPLSEIAVVASLYEDEYLYVFDRANSRVVRFDKSGVYKNQYKSDAFAQASDMTVMTSDAGENTLLFSSGSTIYKIPLE